MFSKLDNLMQSLGDIPPHGPLLLTWSLLHQLLVTSQQDGVGSVGVVKRCGNASLQLKVFQYLSACLSMEPFSGNTVSRLNDTLMEAGEGVAQRKHDEIAYGQHLQCLPGG